MPGREGLDDIETVTVSDDSVEQWKCTICGRTRSVSLVKDVSGPTSRPDGWACYSCEYWKDVIAAAESEEHKSVRVSGKHWTVHPEHPGVTDGLERTIEFSDGHVVVTTNMAYQGIIPWYFRESLPDNAKFVRVREVPVDEDAQDD